MTVLLLWLLSCFSFCRLCDSHQQQSQPFRSHAHTQPQTHMNNVSGEEIAAGWQRRWFPAAIQNSLRERERGREGANTCISNWGFVVRKESGEDREGSCLNSSRREMRGIKTWIHNDLNPFLVFFLLLSCQRRGEERWWLKGWSCEGNYWLGSQTLSYYVGTIHTKSSLPSSSRLSLPIFVHLLIRTSVFDNPHTRRCMKTPARGCWGAFENVLFVNCAASL